MVDDVVPRSDEGMDLIRTPKDQARVAFMDAYEAWRRVATSGASHIEIEEVWIEYTRARDSWIAFNPTKKRYDSF